MTARRGEVPQCAKNTVGAAGLPPLAGEMSEGQRGHKAISPDVQTSPSRSEGDAGSEATRRGCPQGVPARRGEVPQCAKTPSGQQGCPRSRGKCPKDKGGHKAISTTYNPSPSMGEGQGEGDTTTFANQRRSIAGQTVHCYKTTIMTSQKTKPNVCNVPNRDNTTRNNLDDLPNR